MAYTTVNDPSAHFQTTLYTGNGTSQDITNTGNSNLRPDWLWIKQRSGAAGVSSHVVKDSNRGVTKELYPNANSAEGTSSLIDELLTDGFSINNTANDHYNYNGALYVAWQWAAGGAAPTKTYKVVVVSDSGNKYRFRNSADNATFAASAVTLDLQEGGTYTFDVSDNTVDSHPFVIGTSANSNEYSTGVTYKLDGVTKTYSQYTSGFSAATTRQLIITVAASAPTLYYWCSVHSGMGGQINTNSEFGSTNFDGSILTKVSANTTAGFSIVTYTGNATSGATIGHGLGSVPKAVFTKTRAISDNWLTYHASLGATKYMTLNTTSAPSTNAGGWNDTTPTSTVVTLGSFDNVNDNDTMVAYCFSEVKGYSKFGSYTANGNADGAFTYTGFRPAWLMIKCTSHTGEWFMVDTTRELIQPVGDKYLEANSTTNESSNAGKDIDILSNGFKNRAVTGFHNDPGRTYAYYAFAEAPMVASNNIVGLAR